MTTLLRIVGLPVLETFALVIWGAAVVLVIRTPARRFGHGWWTKSGRIVIALGLYADMKGLFIPFGAALVLIALRRTGREPQALDLAPPHGPQLPC